MITIHKKIIPLWFDSSVIFFHFDYNPQKLFSTLVRFLSQKTEESNQCGIEPLWNRTNVESNQCGIEPMWSKIYVERNYRGKKLMRNVINEEKNLCGMTLRWT